MKWFGKKQRGVRKWEAKPVGAKEINQRVRECEQAMLAYYLTQRM